MTRKGFLHRIAVAAMTVLLSGMLVIPGASADTPADGTEHSGTPSAWPVMLEAANHTAGASPDYTRIVVADQLASDQRLWIPHAASMIPGEPAEPLTPVVGTLLCSVVPLPLADGNIHLVYDMALTNWARQAVTLTHIAVVDPEDGDKVLAEWD